MSEIDNVLAFVEVASREALDKIQAAITARFGVLYAEARAEQEKQRVLREVELEAQKAQGPYDETQRVPLSGGPVDPSVPGAPQPIDPKTGMHGDYFVLSDAERAKGFVRPVRRSYKHARCGAVTTMAQAIAETYARDPSFYGATFCSRCCAHYPVGAHGDFTWDGTDQKVGT